MIELSDIAVGLLCIYAIVLLSYYKWWRQLPVTTVNSEWMPNEKISIIVPARNEAHNIGACLQSLLQQNYPLHLLEIIVVNDASTDNTKEIIESFSDNRIRLINIDYDNGTAIKAPKKRAIEKAVAIASGTLIVTTDADCIAEKEWIRTIAAYHHQTNNVFIAAPVRIQGSKSVLSKFQALDFLTMQGITAAAVFKRFHNMSNGANLAYEKKVFEEVGGFTGIDNIASGDDMLLMEKISRKYPQQMGYLKNNAAIVTTAPALTWKDFFQQRIRWASKATHYKSHGLFAVLLLVYLANLSILGVLVIAPFYPLALIYFIVLCILKFWVEVFFVKDVATFFQQQQLLPWLLLLQPLHILYIVASGFLGQFKTYEWKGRKLR